MFTSCWWSFEQRNCTDPSPPARTNEPDWPEPRDLCSAVRQTRWQTLYTLCNSPDDKSAPHNPALAPRRPPRRLPTGSPTDSENHPLDHCIARTAGSGRASPIPCSRSDPRTNAPRYLPNRTVCLWGGGTKTPVPRQRHDDSRVAWLGTRGH